MTDRDTAAGPEADTAPLTTQGATVHRDPGFRLVQVDNPAFWLYVVLVVIGALLYAQGFADAVVRPSAFTLAIFLELLYTVPLWWFISRSDRFDRAPVALVVAGFLWGGLVATWVMAAPANSAIISLYAKLVSVDFAAAWGPPLTAPLTEETAKLAGVLMLYLLSRRHVRSVYDGLILGAFVGLGFQVLENVEYIVGAIEGGFNQNAMAQAMQVFVLRSATGFYTHAVYTAIAGGGLAYLLTARRRTLARRVGVFLGLLLVAMVAHAILDAAPNSIVLTVLSPVVGLVGLVVLWRYADRQERGWVTAFMTDEVERGTLSTDEVAAIAGRHTDRRHRLREVRRSSGRQAAKAERHVLEAGYDLATVIAETNDPDSVQAEHARQEVRRVRKEGTRDGTGRAGSGGRR